MPGLVLGDELASILQFLFGGLPLFLYLLFLLVHLVLLTLLLCILLLVFLVLSFVFQPCFGFLSFGCILLTFFRSIFLLSHHLCCHLLLLFTFLLVGVRSGTTRL